MIGRSEANVRVLADRGELECGKVGRIRMFSSESVEEWLKERADA
jgi:hypothetical protein